MTKRVGRMMNRVSEVLAMLFAFGGGIRGASRSADGTFGTQRRQGGQRSQQRDERYPSG